VIEYPWLMACVTCNHKYAPGECCIDGNLAKIPHVFLKNALHIHDVLSVNVRFKFANQSGMIRHAS
jgi:hypothetical protein